MKGIPKIRTTGLHSKRAFLSSGPQADNLHSKRAFLSSGQQANNLDTHTHPHGPKAPKEVQS